MNSPYPWPDAAVRRAVAGDAEELVTLRIVMLESMQGVAVPRGEWSVIAADSLRRRLGSSPDNLAAFVVDRPAADGPGLAACAVGVVEERLGTPSNPGGLSGYVFNVATHAPYRRRGCSTACLRGLVAWFAERGVAHVTLRASEDGRALYEKLGFAVQPGPSMRLTVPR